MKTQNEKIFNSASKKYYEWCSKARIAAINFLKERLEKAEEYSIDMNDANISVIYDGGNHPEYASNLCSSLFYVYIKEENVYLNIEDNAEYDIDRVDTMDLLTICEWIRDSK